MKLKIAPSILASDFSRLGEECVGMEAAGADLLHVDVMDGHFVPNLTLGPPVVASLRQRVKLPLDVHLMLTDPGDYLEPFAKAGADIITFHLEANGDKHELLRRVHEMGLRTGLVLKPATAAEEAFPFLEESDVIMVMTVEPGFGGQKFMPKMLQKIEALRARADSLSLPLDIEVDGGIGEGTAPEVVRAGANVLVAGSALFGKEDYAAAVHSLRSVAEGASLVG